ncbi:hypothetical protein TKK_0000313 [Trichogramma kaykai]
MSSEQAVDVLTKIFRHQNDSRGVEIVKSIPNNLEQIDGNDENNNGRPLFVEEDLSLLVNSNLTKETYDSIRSMSLKSGHKLFPSYEQVSLQNLLHHTISRLLKHLDFKFEEMPGAHLQLLAKYGFDSTNAPCYKQGAADSAAFCTNIFGVSIVPLSLINVDTQETVWTNESPCWTRSCRILEISFEKETSFLCENTATYYRQQIENLQDIEISGCTISTKMFLTMIDGKVLCALTKTSSQSC